MKNKAITITVAILVIVAISSLIYILFNRESVQNSVENNVVEENKEENEIEEKIDNGENVKVDSRRGLQILKNLDFVSKMYSNKYYDELDSYGISNNAKVIASYIKIATLEDYANLLQQEGIDTYFTKSDLENVAKETFLDASEIIHVPVFGADSYVAMEGKYVISSIGFSNLDYAIEVPYKITEYDDRVEVESYRLYANTTVNADEDLEMTVTDTLYYDRAMLEVAYEFENAELTNNEHVQSSFIREKIDANELNKEKLVTVKYVLTKQDDKLLISDYTKGV